MTTTLPPESFRAAFYAGARWSSDTTDRPDAEAAVQNAWEASEGEEEPPPEVECPACGATIRARMADL